MSNNEEPYEAVGSAAPHSADAMFAAAMAFSANSSDRSDYEIEAGTVPFKIQPDYLTGEARRLYRFDGFSMLTQHPPKF
jgi:hypothetical protein